MPDSGYTSTHWDFRGAYGDDTIKHDDSFAHGSGTTGAICRAKDHATILGRFGRSRSGADPRQIALDRKKARQPRTGRTVCNAPRAVIPRVCPLPSIPFEQRQSSSHTSHKDSGDWAVFLNRRSEAVFSWRAKDPHRFAPERSRPNRFRREPRGWRSSVSSAITWRGVSDSAKLIVGVELQVLSAGTGPNDAGLPKHLSFQLVVLAPVVKLFSDSLADHHFPILGVNSKVTSVE